MSSVRIMLNALAKQRQYRDIDPEALKYTDCFETVNVVTKFIKPKYLCDIGGYKGKWTYVMHKMDPELEHVVIFEPQKKFHRELEELDLGRVEKVIYKCGLGDRKGTLEIQGGTASASVLSTAELQTHYFPGSVVEEKESIDIKVLDQVYSEDKLPYPDLIKIDVQGFELNVLKGGRHVLSKAKYLVIELSFREFYVGQPPLSELLRFLEDNHYVMISHGFELKSPKSPMEVLQMDGIFVNTKLVAGYEK